MGDINKVQNDLFDKLENKKKILYNSIIQIKTKSL